MHNYHSVAKLTLRSQPALFFTRSVHQVNQVTRIMANFTLSAVSLLCLLLGMVLLSSTTAEPVETGNDGLQLHILTFHANFSLNLKSLITHLSSKR